jgi:hypothetical protein
LIRAALALSLCATATLAADADFTLVNGTGIDILEVYISPANRNTWGNDRLGRSTLDNGKSRLFRFGDRAACKQDIKVVFDDNAGEAVWEDLDLCEITKITLRYNRSTRSVTAIKE